MSRIYNLKINGQENLINADGTLYFTWSVKDCKRQEFFKLSVFDGQTVVYEKSQNISEQLCIVEDLNLIPLKEYSYQVQVKTDAYDEISGKAFFTATIKNFGSAKWISNGSAFVEEQKKCGSPAQYLKKTFNLEKRPYKSIIHMCGLGMYELYLNGKRVGDRVLEPAFTAYHQRVLYSSYDVSDMLLVGENVIDVILGDGWYNQTSQDTWGFFRAPWRDCVKMLFSLNCDGVETVVSDRSWQVSNGELVSNTLRVGEFYDFSKERVYHGVTLATPPGGVLTPSFIPPIKECEELSPVKIIDGKECKIYDFGKNIAGYCSAKIAGNDGDLVYFEYSDRITNNCIDNVSNSMYIYNSPTYQKDGCKLVGGVNEYKPKFVYHGFRYVAVYTEAEILDIKAYFVRTDLKKKGEFSSSSEMLNKLYAMSTNAILSNYHGMPTDCPHREKNGWTGDAHLSIEPSVYNFDMQFAYKKWIDDFKDNQLPTGQISAIIPTCGWGYNWGSGPAWDLAFFRIPQALLKYYGDVAVVKEVYPYLEKYLNYLEYYKFNDLLCVGLGDWNYAKNIKFDLCPLELSTSCCYKLMLDIMAEFSEIVDKTKIDKYRAISRKTSQAILNKYQDEKSLTGMAAIDYVGIKDMSKRVCSYLEEHDCANHFGILGNKFVFDVLKRCGRSDLGVRILERQDYPSFGYWAVNGQTALCEDFELTNSLNHHMYSPIIEYMITGLCGLQITGLNTFTLKPNLPKSLSEIKYSFETANGTLKVGVYKIDGKTVTKLTVPPNCIVKFDEVEYTFGSYEL
ncbi:MAG: family 78 glycoside hydrolase catalytic domain [Clostridia bacterium]|nr:family 78 glycoside hydrolase catalytic domain [Clostridia bacterium]